MNHFAFLLLVFFQTTFAEAQKVDININRIHGLLIFVYSNAGRPHYSPAIKEFTEKSSYASKMKTIVGDFSALDRSLNRGTGYREEGKGYGDLFSVSDITEVQSSYAIDIDDFMARIQHLLPIEDWSALRKILKESEPIYEKLIWSPYLKEMKALEKLYKKKLIEWKVSERFKQAEKFYNAEWPKDITFKIALYPIPPGSHHSNAHSMSAFESVGVIIGEKDAAGRFGVIFHEMMHSLYSAQTFKFKKELLSWYELDKNDSDVVYRKNLQRYSNEIFATLLGNGWFYEMAAGAVDKTEWYNEKHINTTALAVYDLLKSYLKENKSIDKSFVAKMAIEFKKAFPELKLEPSSVLNSVDVQITGQSFKSLEVKQSIKSILRIESLGISTNSNLLMEKYRASTDEEATLVLLSVSEAKALTKESSVLLEFTDNAFEICKKARPGLWLWTDKAGKARLLGIVEPGKIGEVFGGMFVEL